ncbi:MAG: methyltransferase domain-containing protein [Actinomycetota bacterium]|nr:methyltransferase domain-containing protein [Actinomycetota bacterium]
MSSVDGQDQLLDEQIAYYRARADEYLDGVIAELGAERELDAAIEQFRPAGDVLELACGPGTWTPQLLGNAATVTAVDASREMIAIASARVSGDPRVRFVEANLFSWRPDRRYDVVFFGFWLSHVPLERFGAFWSLVDDALLPTGRVLFVDDNLRTPDELIEGESSSTIQRRLNNGTPYRAVKVPHQPAQLQQRLADLGWNITVTPTSGPFYWGSGTRA